MKVPSPKLLHQKYQKKTWSVQPDGNAISNAKNIKKKEKDSKHSDFVQKHCLKINDMRKRTARQLLVHSLGYSTLEREHRQRVALDATE